MDSESGDRLLSAMQCSLRLACGCAYANISITLLPSAIRADLTDVSVCARVLSATTNVEYQFLFRNGIPQNMEWKMLLGWRSIKVNINNVQELLTRAWCRIYCQTIDNAETVSDRALYIYCHPISIFNAPSVGTTPLGLLKNIEQNVVYIGYEAEW